MRTIVSFLFLFLSTVCVAQETAFIEVEPPTIPISQNFVFVVDASSTINWDKKLKLKFNKAWLEVSNLIGMDEVYYSVYIFHDKGKEKFIPWIAAHHSEEDEKKIGYCTCLAGKDNVKGCTFSKTKQIILENTGVRSYGQAAIGKALEEQVPEKLNRHWVNRQTLTLIIITDGGFSEAADPSIGSGDYKLLEKSIDKRQAARIKKGLPAATIITIGLENVSSWSTSVKRSDKECQEFLRKIGKKYGGGYFLVKEYKRKMRKIR